MKTELFYCNSARLDRKLTNLCSSTSALQPGSKLKFHILPDRQMSFVKILELPPTPGSKLRDMVRFQIIRIYPGNAEDISFDFISFKIEAGWKIVLYILKKNYLKEVLGNERFRGIVLPLQLLSTKEIGSFSNLIIFYPDMTEVWTLENGIPDRVERHDPGGFSVKALLTPENNIINSEKLMTIYPCNKLPESELKNSRAKKFSETMVSIRKAEIYFPEYRVTKPDRMISAITVTALIISLVLLAMTASKQQELADEVNVVNAQIENIRLEAAQNQDALEIIEKLDNELKEIQESAPINVYDLLIRTSKAIDSSSVLLSFGLKGKELTLTLRSRSALSDLAGIKGEFGNVRASNIRTLDDGNKSYTVWVEIEQ